MPKFIKGNLPCGTTGSSPQIECWIPEKNPTGTGLVIFPGGGYEVLSDYEGNGYARHFSEAGIACFVVSYRMGSSGFRHPAMLEDALSAIYTIRSNATQFEIDPDRLGVMGSSAGGHLAASTLVLWGRYKSDIYLRPAFGVLCYPVITTGPDSHSGSIRNLLGENPAPSLIELISCEKQVSTDTPPCFIWHTADDELVSVQNSLMFASALIRHKVPVELHIYPEGKHGLGLNTPFPWANELLRWLKSPLLNEIA